MVVRSYIHTYNTIQHNPTRTPDAVLDDVVGRVGKPAQNDDVERGNARAVDGHAAEAALVRVRVCAFWCV